MAKKKTRLFIHSVNPKSVIPMGCSKTVHDDPRDGYRGPVTGLRAIGYHACHQERRYSVSEANSMVGAANKAQMVIAPGPRDDRAKARRNITIGARQYCRELL